MLPQRMRDTMERLRQNLAAVRVDADEMKAILEELVETMFLSSFPDTTEYFGYAAADLPEPPRQHQEERMECERSRNVHRVSLRRAAATGATAGMERYVKPQPPAPAQSAQPPARSDSRHFLLNDQEDRIAFWEAAQMEAEDKPGGGVAGHGRPPTTTTASLVGRCQRGDVCPAS